MSVMPRMIPALTLWQPWASLCVLPDTSGTHAAKTIETRGWSAPAHLVGQTLAIHAAATKRPLYDLLKAEALGDHRARHLLDAVRRTDIEPTDLPFGRVVGTVRVDDCIPMESIEAGHPEPADWSLARSRVLYIYDATLTIVDRFAAPPVPDVDVSDQEPFGMFEQGRWAWMLSNPQRFTDPPVARGRQLLWRWEPCGYVAPSPEPPPNFGAHT